MSIHFPFSHVLYFGQSDAFLHFVLTQPKLGRHSSPYLHFMKKQTLKQFFVLHGIWIKGSLIGIGKRFAESATFADVSIEAIWAASVMVWALSAWLREGAGLTSGMANTAWRQTRKNKTSIEWFLDNIII